MVDGIPDAWPPAPEEGGPVKRIVPLFPMPSLWLFPYVVLPLHIFEERYKSMVEDCLDGPGRIVLGTVPKQHEDEVSGKPPIYPIAGLGEIGRHNRLDNGNFQLLLFGLQRVHAREVESEHPYRLVEIEPAIESQIPEEDEDDLRAKLVAAILERTEKLTTIPPQVPTSHLADLLTLRMPLPHEVMNGLYCELDVAARVRSALEEHAQRPDLDGEDDDSLPDL